MTDAGFFRGTSADQDNRFADKQKKFLKELNFSPILNTKLNLTKLDVDSLKPWIELKIKEILEKDDDILSESIYEHLAGKEPDGKTLLILLTGLVDEDSKASKFMEELWTKLIETIQIGNGVSPKANAPSSSPGNGVSSEKVTSDEQTLNDHPKKDSDDILKEGDESDEKKAPDETAGDRKSRSRTRTPPALPSGSKSHSGSKSPRHSGSASKDGSKSPSKSRSRSKSDSRSRSRSRSGSKRRSSSRSKSRSRSSSKSRHSKSRSRSPQNRSGRFRRSRSRSGSYRSPRGRRGYIPRGPYRGFSYQDRRRGGGPIGPPRGRRITPPWSRRRSPPSYRRRRTPSLSPRRRSRSPMYRGRRSRSRSPHYGGHMMDRRSPRSHGYSGGPPMGPMGRHMPPHDIHRPVMPPRSPRGPPMEYNRGYGESSVLPVHSPGHLMPRYNDLAPVSHDSAPGPPRPSGSGAYSPRSPSSDRRRHKKDKKHRKHKKSKKRHSSSSSPERRKKHKKHKKSKKHKS